MEKVIKRTKLNKFLLFWYVVLVLVIPVISLLASYWLFDDLNVQKTIFGKVSPILYGFVSLPVYFVYMRIIIKELFPFSNKQAIYLFIPFVVTYAMYFIDKRTENFQDFLIVNSLPLYLGLNLVFFIGLAYLVYDKSKDESPKELLGKLVATLIILFLLFFPAIHFVIFGIEIHSMNSTGYQEVRNLAQFIFAILLMAFFHYKIVIRLYDKGML